MLAKYESVGKLCLKAFHSQCIENRVRGKMAYRTLEFLLLILISATPTSQVKSLCLIYLQKTSHLTSRMSVMTQTRKRSRVNISI